MIRYFSFELHLFHTEIGVICFQEKSVFVHQPRPQQLVRDDDECATAYNRLLTVFDVQGNVPKSHSCCI